MKVTIIYLNISLELLKKEGKQRFCVSPIFFCKCDPEIAGFAT